MKIQNKIFRILRTTSLVGFTLLPNTSSAMQEENNDDVRGTNRVRPSGTKTKGSTEASFKKGIFSGKSSVTQNPDGTTTIKGESKVGSSTITTEYSTRSKKDVEEEEKRERKEEKQNKRKREIEDLEEKIKNAIRRIEENTIKLQNAEEKRGTAVQKLIQGTSLNEEEGWSIVHEYRKGRMKIEKAWTKLSVAQNGSSPPGISSKEELKRKLKSWKEIDEKVCTAKWHIKDAEGDKKKYEKKRRRIAE